MWQRYHYCENPIQAHGYRLRVWSVTTEDAVLEAGPMRTSVTFRSNRQQRISPIPGLRDLHLDRIPAWALPGDRFLLTLSDGVVLGQEFLDKLTRSQETALAHYVARGGVLLVPEGASSFEDKLWSQLPFPKAASDGRQVAVGLGMVIRYPSTALRSGNRAENAWIYEALDKQPSRVFPAGALSEHYSRHNSRAEGARAARSRNACLLFAGLFTLVTGPVAWLFRKASRRRFLWMLGSAVATFCVLVILLSVSLSKSSGELWWSSLTEIPSQGGALQTAVFEMESAGARSHTLRLVDPDARFRQRDRSANWLSFFGASSEVQVPLLPWARDSLNAEGYVPNVKPIQCRLEMLENESLNISWDNPNAFEIQAVQLLLSSVDVRPVDVFYQGRRTDSGTMRGTLAGMAIEIEDSRSAKIELGMMRMIELPGYDLRRIAFDDQPPKQGAVMNLGFAYTRGSHYAGIVIFQVDRSPGLAIDEDDSDFVSSGELHYVLQFLGTESLPPYNEIFTSKPFQVPQSKVGRRRV
ncbi:MAG: hypothetical protein ACI957_005535, partial [Verrucomicrobiales bacterium]